MRYIDRILVISKKMNYMYVKTRIVTSHRRQVLTFVFPIMHTQTSTWTF